MDEGDEVIDGDDQAARLGFGTKQTEAELIESASGRCGGDPVLAQCPGDPRHLVFCGATTRTMELRKASPLLSPTLVLLDHL